MNRLATFVIALSALTATAEAAVVTVEKGAIRILQGGALRTISGSVDVHAGDVVEVRAGAIATLEYAEGCQISLPEGETTINDDLCPDRAIFIQRNRFSKVGADAAMLGALAPPYAGEASSVLVRVSSSVADVISRSYDQLHGVMQRFR